MQHPLLIDSHTLQQRLGQPGLVIVDVRGRAAYEFGGHIPRRSAGWNSVRRSRAHGVRVLQSINERNQIFAVRYPCPRLRFRRQWPKSAFGGRPGHRNGPEGSAQVIFKKFYRTKKAEKSGEAGTGIGLSIVEQIVTHTRRTIEVTSEPGKGSCFTIDTAVRLSEPLREPTHEAEPLLVVEDDPRRFAPRIVTCLELEGYRGRCGCFHGGGDRTLASEAYPIVISDIYIDERTGIDVLDPPVGAIPACAVILMTGRGTMETVMAATAAAHSITSPSRSNSIVHARNHQARRGVARPTMRTRPNEEELPETEMIGSSPRMVEIYKTVSRVAPTDATVLIEGETGTGKELVARMIHRYSSRAQAAVRAGGLRARSRRRCWKANCSARMRGAFTGADRDRVGVFEAANRGTVFLDEIGEIDTSFQLKLLRFLQEREIRPVGASRAKKVDVRVIAATNRDLQKMVDEGKFREDLWYRLNVVRIDDAAAARAARRHPAAGAFLRQ